MGPLLKFVMLQGAKAFAATIGPQCLTDDAASIAADGNVVSVVDTPACAAEIRTIAENTILFADEPIVTLTGSPDALAMAREKLEARFGRSPSPTLRFLAPTQHCRCLVMVGKKHQEASDLAASLLPRAPETKKSQAANPRLPDDNPLSGDKGLIWQVTPTPLPSSGDGPLVN